MIHKKPVLWWIALLAALTLLLAACGGDAGEGAEDTPAPPATPQDTLDTDDAQDDEEAEPATGEPYLIGLTNSMTGPLAPAYGANTEGFRVFFEQVNASGGINGHPVELLIEDNASDAAQVSQHARQFVGAGVHAMVTATASISYEPLIAAGTEAEIPVILGGGAGCPPTVLPPEPDPWTFCSSGGVAEVDGPVAAHLLRQLAEEEINVGLVALDVPVSRSEVERVAEVGGELGLTVVETAVVPRGAQDYVPFATQLNRAGVDFVFAWAPWSAEAGVFQALDQLGWQGTYLTAIQPPTEADLARIQRDNLYVYYARGMTAEGTTGVEEMQAAADQVGASSPPETWVDAWLSAQALAAGLEACGWPCAPTDLRDALETISVDTGGLTGAPMAFAPDSHFAFSTWKVYRWDSEQGAVTAVTDWIEFTGLARDEQVRPVG